MSTNTQSMPTASELRTNGVFLMGMIIDESMNNPNAGNQEFYLLNNKVYVITTWNQMAEEHEPGDTEVDYAYPDLTIDGSVGKYILVNNTIKVADIPFQNVVGAETIIERIEDFLIDNCYDVPSDYDVYIKNDEGNLGIIVDVFKRGSTDELVDSATYWFEDYEGGGEDNF